MGNDAKFICMDCNMEEHLGRAYQFDSEQINKKIPQDTLEKLKLAVKRFEMTLRQIEIYGEEYSFNFFEDEILFLEEHKGHNVWLIDDYFEERKKLEIKK